MKSFGGSGVLAVLKHFLDLAPIFIAENAEGSFTVLFDDLGLNHKLQGDELRVTGKKRDDLQEAIAHVKAMKIELPLQYVNFRD